MRYWARELGSGIDVTLRVSIAVNSDGSRLRAGCSVLPVRQRMKSTRPPPCSVRIPFFFRSARVPIT